MGAGSENQVILDKHLAHHKITIMNNNNSTQPARVITQRVQKLKIEGQRKINKSDIMQTAYLLAGAGGAIFAVCMAVSG